MSAPFVRIGHGGASAIAPGNTLTSFDAAVEVGVDMIEFDVRRWQGELILAHTILNARRGPRLGLRRALEHLAEPQFAEVEFNVDVKHLGCERDVIDELARAGLLPRTILSSQVPAVLSRVRELAPDIRTGISVGGWMARFSRRWDDWRGQVLNGLAERRWDVLMAQHRLIDGRLLSDVSAHGGQLYAWTVNQRSAIESLRRLGVHGVTTADPRLFALSLSG